MREAYARIVPGQVPFGIFISGPSKTADIEQSLVIGGMCPVARPSCWSGRRSGCKDRVRQMMRLRLMTYNIHKGIGGIDRRYRPDRIMETVRHYEPDVVLLQEVDEGTPRSHHHRQVDLLGDALEMPYRVYQPNVRLKVGQYGNAILSRHPLTDMQDLDLTIPLKKRRRR